MKGAIPFIAVLLVASSALYLSQRRVSTDAVNPNAIVNLAADWQRDLTRVPMHVTRISDSEEAQIGEQLAKQYETANRLEDSESRALVGYVGEIGARVAGHAKRRLTYHFHLIPNVDFINAFALPGGEIFVGQGLLNQLTSEDELAFVLGHEIEHVDHFHAVERVQVEAQMKHIDLDAFTGIAQIPISLWQAGYSKDEELEADREGLRIAVTAGYSAQGAVKMLERWTKLQREYVTRAGSPPEELSQIAIEGLEGYSRSHPLPSERLAHAKKVIAEDQLPMGQPLKPFHLEYEVTSTAHKRNEEH